MGKMTVTKIGPDNEPTIEICDRDGEHVASLSLEEAAELRDALGWVLPVEYLGG